MKNGMTTTSSTSTSASRSASRRRRLRAASVVVLSLMTLPLFAQTAAEDGARRRLESAKDYMRLKNYKAALSDLDDILKNFATTSVADDALLEQAKYALDVVRDPVMARTLMADLRKRFPLSDSVPMSYII